MWGKIKKVGIWSGKKLFKSAVEEGLDVKAFGKMSRSKRERVCREVLELHLEACLEDRRRSAVHPLVDAGDAMDEVAVMSAYVLAYALRELGYDQAEQNATYRAIKTLMGGLVEEEKG